MISVVDLGVKAVTPFVPFIDYTLYLTTSISIQLECVYIIFLSAVFICMLISYNSHVYHFLIHSSHTVPFEYMYIVRLYSYLLLPFFVPSALSCSFTILVLFLSLPFSRFPFRSEGCTRIASHFFIIISDRYSFF